MRPVIIIFAKAPIPGRVKTRLRPPLTPETAAGLYDCLVRDTLELMLRFAGRADVELHTDAETDAWGEYGLARRRQGEGALGAKMLGALARALLEEDRPQAIIVGSDSPALRAEDIEWLLEAQEDVALGPTEDGGYYAIACRALKKDMFAGVSWSTAKTMRETVAAVRACGLSVAIGAPSFDVDTPADLERIMAMGDALPAHTRRFCADLVWPDA